MVVLLAIVRRRVAGLEGQRMAGSLARITFAALVMGGVAGSLALLLAGATVWVTAGVAVVAGAVVYLGVTAATGSPEPRAVWTMVRSGRRVRRSE
jgi:hypothetical protein